MEQLKILWEDYRKFCLIGIGIVACLIVGWYLQVHQADQSTSSNLLTDSSSGKKVTSQSSSQTKEIYVDVKGAVNHPGVYSLQHGLRVQDALTKAGGTTGNADINHVNMAQQVNDQQVVYVPVQGEVTTPVAATGDQSATTTGSGSESSAPVVNLNTASKDQLMEITGVGEKKADLIIQYRQEHGQFKTVDDLKDVSGFGDKSVAKIKDQLAV